jgi:hypothetical protein
MNDLYEALRKAIYDYMHVDELSVRKQQKIKGAYARHSYDYDAVDALTKFGEEETEK